jgi:hypothetical protein
MSPTGGGKPLFDLISSGRRAEGGGPAPRAASRERPPRSELGARTVTLPMVWIYAGIGLVLMLLIAGYGIGYSLGTSATREAERREAARDAERVFVADPLREENGADTGGAETDRARTERRVPSGGATPPPRPTARVVLSDGRLGFDPRQEGLNYLELVTLPRERAIEAVRYLQQAGEEAIAVPLGELDPGARRSNTSDSFRVIAMGLAVPGDRFKSSTDARKRFEDRLARLGKAWSEQGGASDFSDPLWRKYGK